MSTLKIRIAKELQVGTEGTISKEFMKNELKNAELKFTTRGQRKRVCKILIDGKLVAEGDYNISEEDERTQDDAYGYSLASYNATRVLEDHIKQIADRTIKIEFVASP